MSKKKRLKYSLANPDPDILDMESEFQSLQKQEFFIAAAKKIADYFLSDQIPESDKSFVEYQKQYDPDMMSNGKQFAFNFWTQWGDEMFDKDKNLRDDWHKVLSKSA